MFCKVEQSHFEFLPLTTMYLSKFFPHPLISGEGSEDGDFTHSHWGRCSVHKLQCTGSKAMWREGWANLGNSGICFSMGKAFSLLQPVVLTVTVG